MISIGTHTLSGRALLAPMAGVTDLPHRLLCRRFGAALAPSEMVSSDPGCRDTRKTRLRLDHRGEASPRSVQIVGAESATMAAAAAANVDRGAEIIDINMGCPAKKVCRKAAGSALLRDERLVADILEAVVRAVPSATPVTLKIRTGWDEASINAPRIATIAEDCGIRALAVHGRTRAGAFRSPVEYDTIAAVVATVRIPVFANGDITSARQAREVLDHTRAAGVMIGRAAQGNPWIFREINALLDTGAEHPPPSVTEILALMQEHLGALHRFYGDYLGLRIARKHIGWYLARLDAPGFRSQFNRLDSAEAQCDALRHFAEQLTGGDIAA